jgi:hypothetical protein
VGRYGWKGGKGVGAEKGSTSLIQSKRGKERKKTSGRFRAQPAVLSSTPSFSKKPLAGAILHYRLAGTFQKLFGGNFFKKTFGGNFLKNI